jgi:hypothetical protein
MTGNKAMLDEFNYYKAHQDEIVAGHIGEIAIIHSLRFVNAEELNAKKKTMEVDLWRG